MPVEHGTRKKHDFWAEQGKSARKRHLEAEFRDKL